MTKNETKTKEPESARRGGFRVWFALMAAVFLVALVLLGLFAPSALESLWPFGADDETDETNAAQFITDPDASLASFYEPEVLYWEPYIMQWAQDYQVNPNVLAIVIQIESCGNPVAESFAGAIGLMQVMPFHFDDGENMVDPHTNVRNGMTVFYECLTQFANWDLGVALACYNGGPGVTVTDFALWPLETQAYYRWATGLWQEVISRSETSDTLSQWLSNGGQGLCDEAATYLFGESAQSVEEPSSS